jgi:hypothetical protein
MSRHGFLLQILEFFLAENQLVVGVFCAWLGRWKRPQPLAAFGQQAFAERLSVCVCANHCHWI